MPEIRVRQCANALPASRLVWASLVTTAYHMLNDGTFHRDLGADFLVKRDGPERPMWVNSVDLGRSDGCPLFPRKWRRSGHAGPSGLGPGCVRIAWNRCPVERPKAMFLDFRWFRRSLGHPYC